MRNSQIQAKIEAENEAGRKELAKKKAEMEIELIKQKMEIKKTEQKKKVEEEKKKDNGNEIGKYAKEHCNKTSGKK